MIKNKLPIFGLTGLLLVGILCCISFKIGKDDIQEQSSEQLSEQLSVQQPNTYSCITSAPMPSTLVFAGETIDLTRYDIRERLDREINIFTYLHASCMLQIKRANRYFPVIEPVLAKYEIPDDFKYLSVIESMLDVRARSPAKAAGLWQFIPETGKLYGLEITSQVDERYHVEKSTEAACRYLLDAYKKLGSWVNAAASYNAGMQRIDKSLQQQQVSDALDLFLTEETSRYVFRILAAKMIFSHPYQYGFLLKREDLYPNIRTKTVEVTKNIPNLINFAKANGVDYLQLKNFNAWLIDTCLNVTNKSYLIQIPLEKDMRQDRQQINVHDENWIRKKQS
jgi:hypothetical protein